MTFDVEKYLAPVKAINELTIKNIEKLVNDQVKAVEENTKAGLAAAKEAAQVSDLDGLNAFVTAQVDVARAKTEDLVAEANAYAELGQAYASDVREIVEGAVAA